MRAHLDTHSELRGQAGLPDFPLPGDIPKCLVDALESEHVPRRQAAEYFHQTLPWQVEEHIGVAAPRTPQIAALRVVSSGAACFDVTPFLVAVYAALCRELTPFESKSASAAAPSRVYSSVHGLLLGEVRPRHGFTAALTRGRPGEGRVIIDVICVLVVPHVEVRLPAGKVD